jgi:hypothetical protein
MDETNWPIRAYPRYRRFNLVFSPAQSQHFTFPGQKNLGRKIRGRKIEMLALDSDTETLFFCPSSFCPP